MSENVAIDKFYWDQSLLIQRKARIKKGTKRLFVRVEPRKKKSGGNAT